METYKLHIVLDRNGDKVGDLDACEYAETYLYRVEGTSQELQVNIANVLVLHAFRAMVKEGKIPHKNILLYNSPEDLKSGHYIRIDKSGSLESYPSGMLDTYGDILMKLL